MGKIIINERQYNILKGFLVEKGASRKQRSVQRYAQNILDKEKTDREAAQQTQNTEEPELNYQNTKEPISQDNETTPGDTKNSPEKVAGDDEDNGEKNIKKAAVAMNNIDKLLDKYGLNPDKSRKVLIEFQEDIYPDIKAGYHHIAIFDFEKKNVACFKLRNDVRKTLTFKYKDRIAQNKLLDINTLMYRSDVIERLVKENSKIKIIKFI